ncbi:MAG: hypothetical protein ACNA78_06635 [Balneolaceae bacterium]
MNILSEIHSFFVLLLAIFTLAATFLAIYSMSNVIRLRNVRMRWRTGKMAGFPLFSTLFVVSVAGVTAVAYDQGAQQYDTILACYLWMGVCWFVSSYTTSKSYITDHGIVKNINDTSQTVAWHQICDYVEKPESKGSVFVFMYRKEQTFDEKIAGLSRIELFVPDRHIQKFEKIVSLKIGKSMAPAVGSSFDFKAID